MKEIVIKDGAKTRIKIVPDDYKEPEKEFIQKDVTTSLRRSVGFLDIPKERWDKLFDNKSK